jgi:hypothetical protein
MRTVGNDSAVSITEMREDDRTSNDSQYTGGHPDYIPIDEATRNAL